MKADSQTDRVRRMWRLAALVLLVVGIWAVLQPFVVPMAWATILVLSSWPIHRVLDRWMPRHPNLTATAMTTFLLLVIALLVGPLVIAGSHELSDVVERIGAWASTPKPQLSPWAHDLPWIGPRLQEQLDRFEVGNLVGNWVQENRTELMGRAGDILKLAFHVLFSLFMCLLTAFFLYRHGGTLALQVRRVAIRMGGSRFERLLSATRGTVRGAVYGILLTSLVQALLAGAGFFVAGTPVPLLLAFATLVVSPIPFGPPVIYLPAAVLIVMNGAPPWHGVLLGLWGLGVVSTADNILRPIFISQATHMPVLMVFFGVIGGLASFGMIGVFIGPVILAIAQALWMEWAEPELGTAGMGSSSDLLAIPETGEHSIIP